MDLIYVLEWLPDQGNKHMHDLTIVDFLCVYGENA